jgi:putative glycosyltransferase (TIGR04372 family)
MKVLLVRTVKIANDRLARILFYDQTLKKGYASLGSFSKFSIIKRLVITVVALPIAFLFWIILVIANRFMPVRIYRIARPQRPAFASVYIELLEPLCRGLQVEKSKSFCIFIDAGAEVNRGLTEIYKSQFHLYLDDKKTFLRSVFNLIPGIGFSKENVLHSRYNLDWELPQARNYRSRGPTKIRNAIGVAGLESGNFVTVSHPSVSYYKIRMPAELSEMNRFIELGPARMSFEYLIEHGLKIVRVGVDTDPMPECLRDLPIIDLSGQMRDDLQDLWLFENCFFHWSLGGNGAWWLARKFDRPSLCTDSYAIGLGNLFSFYTYQGVWDDDRSKFLSLGELLGLKGVISRTSKMSELKLRYVQNSPEQLLAAVTEVVSSLRNGTAVGRYDQSLLDKYDEIIINAGHPPRREIHTRPCLSFLESIQDQLV